MGIVGEQLLATTGILAAIEPGPVRVTKKLLNAADRLPTRARARMAEAVAADGSGKSPAIPALDYDHLLELLPPPLDNDAGQRRLLENVAGWPDQQLANEYAGALGRAWGYLQTQFPVRTREHLSGTENVRPAEADVTRFRRILAVVEDPLSILDRLEFGELLSDEVAALKASYPALLELLQQQAIGALIDETAGQRAKDPEWNLPRRKDLMLRRLLEQPPSALDKKFKSEVQKLYESKREDGEKQSRPDLPTGKLPSTDAELTRVQKQEAK